MLTKNSDAETSYTNITKNIGGYKLIQKEKPPSNISTSMDKKEIIEYLYLHESLAEHYPLSKLYPLMDTLPIKNLYTTTSNYISIAESIDQGRLTLNVIQDSKKDNFVIKGDFKKCNKIMRYL